MAINLEHSLERSADRHTVNETDRLRLARFLADLLDQRFTIPGTSIRIGLDPIVSLIPGIGDLWAPLLAQKGRAKLNKFYDATD